MTRVLLREYSCYFRDANTVCIYLKKRGYILLNQCVEYNYRYTFVIRHSSLADVTKCNLILSGIDTEDKIHISDIVMSSPC